MHVLKTDCDRSKYHLDTMLVLAHLAKEAVLLDFVVRAASRTLVQRYWHSVLKRLISITKVLCERCLELRGEDR